MDIFIFFQRPQAQWSSKQAFLSSRDREGPESTVLNPEGEEGAFQNFLSWPLFPNQYMGEWGKRAEMAFGGLASQTPACDADATPQMAP